MQARSQLALVGDTVLNLATSLHLIRQHPFLSTVSNILTHPIKCKPYGKNQSCRKCFHLCKVGQNICTELNVCNSLADKKC